MAHNVSYYRELPYTRRVEPRKDADGTTYFVARIVEIPPLRIHGATKEEALLKLDEIFDDVIDSMLQGGEEVPEPEQWPGPGDMERVDDFAKALADPNAAFFIARKRVMPPLATGAMSYDVIFQEGVGSGAALGV